MATGAASLTTYQRWRRRIVTPEMIYGTLLVSSVIAVADDEEPDWVVLFFVVLSAVVFYIAHVFAGTIGHQGDEDERAVPLRRAIAHSVTHSAGILYAAVLPSLVLLVGALVKADPAGAQSVALGFTLLLFLVLGWQAMSERGARWAFRLLGSLVTLGLGLFVILLEALSH